MARPRLPLGAHGDIWTIQQDDGRWIARAMLRTNTGKRRQIQRLAATETKAKTALRTALRDYTEEHSTGVITGRSTLKQLADLHLERLRERGRAASTLAEYERVTEKYIAKIADMRVNEATAPVLWKFLDEMRTDHGRTTAKTARSVLSGMFDAAVSSGAVGANPLRDVKIEEETERGPRGSAPLPVDQVDAFATAVRVSQALEESGVRDVLLLQLGTGLRVGEAAALRWQDVDLDAGTITVSGMNRRQKGKGVVRQDFTKSDAGARTIVVPAMVLDVLKKRERVGDMVFCGLHGGNLDPRWIERKVREERDAMGFPDFTTHSARKMIATMLDDAGLSARQIADYLGHSRPSMTTDVYMQRKASTAAAAEILTNRIA